MPLAHSYDEAKTQVERLVERFDRNLDLYKRSSYKEARVRVEFLDPFFEALGWDVRNVQGCGEHDKDVIHEDVVRIGGKPRAPDYSFRIGQKRQFFVEAKKLAAATIAADKELYQRQIEATDWQIDALVYELYDLTEEEIAIVEQATA